MRELSGHLRQLLAQECMTLCRIATLILRDGSVHRYTDAASPLLINGATYYPGCEVSAIRGSYNEAASNASLSILYDDDRITEEDTRRGRLDGATYEIAIVDYTDPAQPGMRLLGGRVQSIVTSNRSSATLEIGAYTAGNLVLGENYSQRCRNVFGDDRCKVDKSKLAVEFVVTEVSLDRIAFRTDIPLGEGEDARTESTQGLIVFDAPGVYEWIVPDCDLVTFTLLSSGGGAGESSDHNGQDFRDLANFYRGQNGENGLPAVVSRRAGLDTSNTLDDAMDVAKVLGGTAGAGTYYDGQHPPWTWAQLNVGPYFGGLSISTVLEFTPFAGGLGGKGLPSIKYGAQFAQYFPSYNSAGQDGSNGHLFRVAQRASVEGGLVVGETLYVSVPAGGHGGGEADNPATTEPTGSNLPGPNATGGGTVSRPSYAGPAADGRGVDGQPGAAGAVRIEWGATRVLEARNYVVGTVTWITGYNAQTVGTVSTNGSGGVQLTVPARNEVRVGDRGRLEPGCTNYADMCEARYNNLKNMQAEPVVPQGASAAPSSATTTVADKNKPADTLEDTSSYSGLYPTSG